MCISRKTEVDYLGIGLSARIAIDTLIGFYDTEEIWHASKKGIEIINEVRDILLYMKESKHDTSFLFFKKSFKHFKKYDEMVFLRDMVQNIQWKTWESDLEQWLTNKEQVLDYFMYLENHALGSINHCI